MHEIQLPKIIIIHHIIQKADLPYNQSGPTHRRYIHLVLSPRSFVVNDELECYKSDTNTVSSQNILLLHPSYSLSTYRQ